MTNHTPMRFRVALAAALLSAVCLFGAPGAAFADVYCETDPPVVIQTPSGSLVVVYVVTVGPIEHVAQLLAPSITYEAKPTGGGATRVDLYVTVADVDGHRHEVASEVWTGAERSGALLSSESGRTGSPMRHKFQLNVP